MTAFHEKIGLPPPVYDADKAERLLAELTSGAGTGEGLETLGELISKELKVRDLLLAVFGASPYLSSLILRNPGALARCLTSEPDAYMAELGAELDRELASADTEKTVMTALRVYKQKAALTVALADIAEVWPTDKTTRVLSDVAERSVWGGLRFLLSNAARSGDLLTDDMDAPEKHSGYIVLGVGKLGAHELNYSSDIDLIVFYDRERASLRDGLEPAEFFVRLTRNLVRLLQERTADGYVFRTDLRLRPDPGATQVALSTEAGLTYYESFGQNWERAALIKARVIAGDHEAGDIFLEQLSPFIWRRYLDFAAIADIHSMKRRVHVFKGHGRIAVAGHNIKLGRGGIREIEFFAQTQQLIAGGRQPELRTPETQQTLNRLAQQGWIDKAAAAELASAYWFLRRVEHRLQMLGDEQTHTLPSSEDELERLARFCGFDGAEAFGQALVEQLSRVQGHYDELFEKIPDPEDGTDALVFRGDDEAPGAQEALEQMGFADPPAVTQMVRTWFSGRYAATRSERSRERLREFLPHLFQALTETADPDAALASFDRFLSELPAGVQLFSLLRSNPSLLRLIADIMGTAPRLAKILSRRTRVLDAVLDPGFFGDLPPPEALETLITEEMKTARDYQDCLDRARVVGQEQAFLIGVRILSGTIAADLAGGAYANLAASLIAALHAEVERELVRRHGRLKNGEAAVIAMGKLGGREMTASSDLDLIIVYDFDESVRESDGEKPLAGEQYFARFTQRLISAISAPTPEGRLYEVDMRLRPSGHAGPVATRYDSFLEYQRTKAWTWEHMALTRAWVISGPEELRKKIERVIRDVLTLKRDRAQVAADVREMRARIEKEKGAGDPWDLKQVRGGLVDLEFIAQFLQLVWAHDHPEILDRNTTASLEKLAGAGVLPKEEADILIPAARLYHNLTQALRLCLDRPFDPGQASPGLKDLLARAADMPDFASLEAKLKKTISGVAESYERIVA